MRTVYVHIGMKPQDVRGTVVCAMRPLPGDKTWEGDSVGNGVYYAVGDLHEYKKMWEYLDAAIVHYLTNEEITERVKAWLSQEVAMTLDEALEKVPMERLCDMAGLPRIE